MMSGGTRKRIVRNIGLVPQATQTTPPGRFIVQLAEGTDPSLRYTVRCRTSISPAWHERYPM